MALTKNQVLDFKKYFVEGGEPGFSPKRNRETIERTIAKHELNVSRKKKAYEEAVRERSDAVASYLKHVAAGKDRSVDRYFGKRGLAYLRAQKIIQEIKGRMKILSSIEG